MRLALIPPRKFLPDTNRTEYQLMLPQHLNDKPYRQQYTAHVVNPNQFTILDNGVAERVPLEETALAELVRKYLPNEVVMPDRMTDMERTTTLAVRWQRYDTTESTLNMMAAQGSTEWEVCAGIQWASKRDWIDSIGIPRHLLSTLNNIEARLNLAKWTNNNFKDRFEIHFLGASSLWPEECKEASQLPFVRGMDTSMPYNYALQRVSLSHLEGQIIDRPENYFNKTNISQKHTVGNINTMLRWCQ